MFCYKHGKHEYLVVLQHWAVQQRRSCWSCWTSVTWLSPEHLTVHLEPLPAGTHTHTRTHSPTGNHHHLIINYIDVVTSCPPVFTLSSATASGMSVSTLQEEDEEPELLVRRLRCTAASPDRHRLPYCMLNLASQLDTVLGCRPPPFPCPPMPMAPPPAPTTLPAPAPPDTWIEKESGGLSAGGASWSAARSWLRVQRQLAPVSGSLQV